MSSVQRPARAPDKSSCGNPAGRAVRSGVLFIKALLSQRTSSLDFFYIASKLGSTYRSLFAGALIFVI